MWTKRLETHAAKMRAAAKAYVATHPEPKPIRRSRVSVPIGEFRAYRIAQAKARGIEYPSHCPRCRHTEVIRAGVVRGKQRFRCRSCKRTFGAGRSYRVAHQWNLICHRCGGTNARNGGPGKSGGRIGYCEICKRYFTQGGPDELDHNGALLRWRIASLEIPAEIATEVLQQATLDVLEGRGYCWSVEIDQRRAWRAVRGDSWLGSDSKAYRAAIGDRY